MRKFNNSKLYRLQMKGVTTSTGYLNIFNYLPVLKRYVIFMRKILEYSSVNPYILCFLLKKSNGPINSHSMQTLPFMRCLLLVGVELTVVCTPVSSMSVISDGAQLSSENLYVIKLSCKKIRICTA